MSLLPGPAYHFRTKKQWDCVRISGLAERFSLDPKAGVDCGFIDCPAMAAALSARGDLYWVDLCHILFAARRDLPWRGVAGPALGKVVRLVAGRERLWALADCAAPGGGEGEAPARRLIQVDARTLHILINRDVGDAIDIAGDGKDGLWLLGKHSLRRISARGAPVGRTRALEGAPAALAAAAGRLALLSEDGRRLTLLDPASGTTIALDLPKIAGPGWSGEHAGISAAGAAFLIDGTLGPERGFLLLDRDGSLLAIGGWRDGRAPDLLVAAGDDLVGLFGENGGQRLRRFAGLARPGSERRLTPPLETISPAGTWLRAEIVARLPERATLGLRWAATDDFKLADLVEHTLADPAEPMARRLERVKKLLHWSKPFTYVGERHDGQAPAERFAFPLHAVSGSLLWVDLQIARNSADSAPEIDALLVIHEARSLMDDLPAIYRGDGDQDGTMRRLVGVLEATTQGMDYRIARLAARLDPDQTSARWLPDLAAMLGLPFHEALTGAMQRRLVRAAPDILTRRGTRLGLLAMLHALFPGRPVRVIDRTELLVPISLGRGGVGGRALPAMLAGPSIRVPKLNARLVLGRTGLCETSACADALIAPGPEVLISIPARVREQQRFRDAIAEMVEAMVPAGVRVRLRWTPWRNHGATRPDDVLTMIDSPERLSLGVGPALGRARTGGRGAARLDGQGSTPADHRLL
jgi:phage tail-like protein